MNPVCWLRCGFGRSNSMKGGVLRWAIRKHFFVTLLPLGARSSAEKRRFNGSWFWALVPDARWARTATSGYCFIYGVITAIIPVSLWSARSARRWRPRCPERYYIRVGNRAASIWELTIEYFRRDFHTFYFIFTVSALVCVDLVRSEITIGWTDLMNRLSVKSSLFCGWSGCIIWSGYRPGRWIKH